MKTQTTITVDPRVHAFGQLFRHMGTAGLKPSPDENAVCYDGGLIFLACDVIDKHNLPLYPILLDGTLIISFINE